MKEQTNEKVIHLVEKVQESHISSVEKMLENLLELVKTKKISPDRALFFYLDTSQECGEMNYYSSGLDVLQAIGLADLGKEILKMNLDA